MPCFWYIKCCQPCAGGMETNLEFRRRRTSENFIIASHPGFEPPSVARGNKISGLAIKVPIRTSEKWGGGSPLPSRLPSFATHNILCLSPSGAFVRQKE